MKLDADRSARGDGLEGFLDACRAALADERETASSPRDFEEVWTRANDLVRTHGASAPDFDDVWSRLAELEDNTEHDVDERESDLDPALNYEPGLDQIAPWLAAAMAPVGASERSVALAAGPANVPPSAPDTCRAARSGPAVWLWSRRTTPRLLGAAAAAAVLCMLGAGGLMAAKAYRDATLTHGADAANTASNVIEEVQQSGATTPLTIARSRPLGRGGLADARGAALDADGSGDAGAGLDPTVDAVADDTAMAEGGLAHGSPPERSEVPTVVKHASRVVAPSGAAPTAKTAAEPRVEEVDGSHPLDSGRNAAAAALERKAKDAWSAGDLDLADEYLRQVIAGSKSAQRAELAWGDRFSIAHLRGNRAHEQQVWRAYLRARPRGVHADDASAGLCRTAQSEASARACWCGYLEAFSEGVHRARGERECHAP